MRRRLPVAAQSSSDDFASTIASATFNAVSRPSPERPKSGKMMCPDGSPPSITSAQCRCISSKMNRSPTSTRVRAMPSDSAASVPVRNSSSKFPRLLRRAYVLPSATARHRHRFDGHFRRQTENGRHRHQMQRRKSPVVRLHRFHQRFQMHRTAVCIDVCSRTGDA